MEKQDFHGPEIRVPLIYPPLKSNVTILFVGLNPSFGERWSWLKKLDKPILDDDPKRFFLWENFIQRGNEDKDLLKAQDVDKKAKEHYRFYKAFDDFAKGINNDATWEHVDLFFYRLTQQNAFKKIIYTNGKLNDFAKKQLELSMSLVRSINPKIIMVANALASHLLEQEQEARNDDFHPLKIKFQSALGCHVFESDGMQIPVFLSSMLDGQRAMDIYSRQRLQWHIVQVLGRSGRIFNQ